MSIYLGKDDSNNNIMHITNGVTSVNDLKSGVLTNTVFHSGLPLSSYKLIAVSPGRYYPYKEFASWKAQFAYSLALSWYSYYDTFSGRRPCLGVQVYSIGTSDYSYLINSVNTKPNRVLLLDSNFKIVPGISLLNFTSITQDKYGIDTHMTKSTAYTLGILQYQYQSWLNAVYYILVIEDNFYPALSGSISINNRGFYIGSTDAFSGRNLVTTSPVNSSIQVTNNLYLSTLSNTASVGLQLITSPNVKLIIGDSVLFDSSINSYLPFKPNTITSITKGITFAISTSTVLLYSIKPTESYCAIKLHYWMGPTYTVVPKGSNTRVLLAADWNYTPSGAVRLDFMYAYSTNDGIYIESIRNGGSAGTDITNYTFEVEAF